MTKTKAELVVRTVMAEDLAVAPTAAAAAAAPSLDDAAVAEERVALR